MYWVETASQLQRKAEVLSTPECYQDVPEEGVEPSRGVSPTGF